MEKSNRTRHGPSVKGLEYQIPVHRESLNLGGANVHLIQQDLVVWKKGVFRDHGLL